MEKTFFISGIGGQGVQVLCKALATVVDECGMNMCLFPWYQGQRRGGATFGRLIISDERVGAPEKRHYDVCVYLDPASLRDYADKRRKGGLVIVNSDLVELPDFDDVTVVSAPFSSTAESAGNERSFNLVVGGFSRRIRRLSRKRSSAGRCWKNGKKRTAGGAVRSCL